MRRTADIEMERIASYLEEVAQRRGVNLPGDEESLFDADVLDSFGVLELVGFIESELGLTIPDEDLGVGHFQSFAKIRAYLDGRAEG
jgi:acyl carrier protein